MKNVLLISTYDLGHQPFGLGSPAAWLERAGAYVRCLDLAVQRLDEGAVREADLVAFYLPMHTATRLAISLIPHVKAINPRAYLCCYGLYAPTNAALLRKLGVDAIIGAEFESKLTELYHQLRSTPRSEEVHFGQETIVSLERQEFLVPNRGNLPGLSAYATLCLPDGTTRTAGYTQSSRGCKYKCRHCPIVPIYNGRFRIIQREVVLADIRQQVQAGAQHITFGDPDFLNGPGHTIPLVQAMHREFPQLTFDATIKIEHLLKHERLLPILRDSGCLFITSAVEAVDDEILALLDKGHTRDDFVQATAIMRELGLVLNPTFVAFTPWTTPQKFLGMMALIDKLDLIENVPPVQYAIRLLIPAGSHLLELAEIKNLIDPFDQNALSYPWQHPLPKMDELYKRIYGMVRQGGDEPRTVLFSRVWQAVLDTAPELQAANWTTRSWDSLAAPVPRLSESWY